MLGKMRIQLNLAVISVALAASLIPDLVSAQGETTDAFEATYLVTFENTWTATTHPTNYPTSNAHWSPLVGGAHNGDVSFWEPGGIASQGIENMAETGSTGTLVSEITNSGEALNTVVGSRLPPSGQDPVDPGETTTIDLTVNKDYPLVTLVTMIAPSPDWFAGVHGESLLDRNGKWVASKVVTLYPYDAGTDSGTTYTSPNNDTNPQEPISSLQGVPPFSSAPVATLTFTRVNYSDLHLSNKVEPETDVTTQGQVTYTLTLDNTGDMDASGTLLTDTLPADTVFASWVVRSGGAIASGDTITWTGTVTQSGTLIFTYVATYTGLAFSERLTNTAEFAHPSGNSGQASAAFTVQPAPVLTLSKSGPSAAKSNAPITYTLSLTNSAPAAALATNVVITDTLPAGSNFASASHGGTLTGDTVEWQLGNLSGERTLQVTLVVTTGAIGFLFNQDYGARANGVASVPGDNLVSTSVTGTIRFPVYLPLIILGY
jgi:uncharacterized repeat protein (TIGR01451 family)